VSFLDRSYPDIVRDVLTNLTQGITGEAHRVEYDPSVRPPQIPDIVLQQRPVRRVSSVEGFISGATPDDPPQPYSFTLNDYELISDPRDPKDVSRIRFLAFGRKPVSGTTVRVNYYPRTTEPVPVNDVSVGSVVRTLLEAVSKELAILYQQLNLAYDSAFVETASGPSLDRVVALLGYQRFRAGRAVGRATFTRRAGATGEVSIPAGTPITDAADKIRYETAESRTLLAGESTAEIAIRGASQTTPVVDANVLTVVQRAIAGIERVTNLRPTARATEDESDDELRARVRDALLSSNKGTVGAIRNGLLALPEVRDVKVQEQPNGVPGEIKVSISLAPGTAAAPGKEFPDSVLDRIEELRPAGIVVVSEKAVETQLAASVVLVLAGGSLPQSEIDALTSMAKETLASGVARRGVGEKVRIQPLAASLLADPRIADAKITLQAKGGAPAGPGADFTPDSGVAVSLAASDIAIQIEFDQAAPAAPKAAIEVRGSFKAELAGGKSIPQVQAALTEKLGQFFGSLPVDASVDAAAILSAVRDDAQYALDPLGLTVTLSSAQQFFQIVQGGPAYRVAAGQTFTVLPVEVRG
jgi:uncharacterized phage protein gp47/JayE